ncbi:MAG: hypothetical protein IKD43_01030 [Clostridia bacterium]|nr:hypothetical protein [Clostridia bacterium]
MAKFFDFGKGRKRLVGTLSLLLSATLTLGIVSACTTAGDPEEEEGKNPSLPVDTQLLKNGNFEYYNEMLEDVFDEKRDLINSPTDWTFSSGSPASDASSGIVNVAEWDKLAVSTRSLIPAEDEREDEPELTNTVIANAVKYWDDASIYDRLAFYDYYDIDSSSDFELYDDYKYSIDLEDVENFKDIAGKGKALDLHKKDGRATDGSDGDSSILMIHNQRTSDSVRGTAQFYTAATTITVPAGASARLSVWVRTSQLYHYAANSNPNDDLAVTARAGAYIGVTNTVGGVTLDQMQIKNINTKDTWEQYTIYVRANTFAATTFRVVLGLGQGASDYRYEAVDGYAFFDDVECELITNDDYVEAVTDNNLNQPEKNFCTLNSKKDEKIFSATDNDTGASKGVFMYALDLSHELKPLAIQETIGLTEEISGSQAFTSEKIDPSLGRDNESDEARGNIAKRLSYNEIQATNNGYLKEIFKNDFANYPQAFDQDNIIMLLSTNGAAYTAKLQKIEVNPNERILVSFFVKTSEIRAGKMGAGAILVDDQSKVKTVIAPFDSTTVDKININDNNKDIYDGWVQCFFFVENTTDDVKSFHIELTYGPTSIADTTKADYADGYAAFADFRTSYLTKAQYEYAATSAYAEKASLTASVSDSSRFDEATLVYPLEKGLSTPANYTGVLAGSNWITESDLPNPGPAQLAEEYGIYTGLLSHQYAENYMKQAEDEDALPAWKAYLNDKAGNVSDSTVWWKNLFGNGNSSANPAYQPLAIMNTSSEAQPSYGYYAVTASLSQNAARRVSVRVKLSANAVAYLYLIDVSDINDKNNTLANSLPSVTYWYDDDGNIVKGDPAADDFDKVSDILYTLEDNGLYKKATDTSANPTYYANLYNYDKDDDGNLVTSDGSIAYYYNNGNFYAYYDEETDAYTQVVKNIPENKLGDAGVRYVGPASSGYEAVIKVEGSSELEASGEWVTVSFYLQTGNKAKDYRLELWAGAREDDASTVGKNEATMAAGSYVFFDRCSTSSVADFSGLMNDYATAMKDKLGLKTGDDLPNVDANGNPLALYYAFTFYDSPDYLRYDATLDEEDLGNPWQNYVQSTNEHKMMWFYCTDLEGLLFSPDGSLKSTSTISLFMSYNENEVTVAPADLGGDSDSSISDSTTEEESDGSEMNIAMYVSSILLVVALAFAVCTVIARRVYVWFKQKNAPKRKKKAAKAAAKAEAPAAEKAPAEAPVAEPMDENDPYNE